MSRLHAWLRALGPYGVIGIGVLFFCMPFYLSAVRPAERELLAQRLAAERLRTRQPYQPVSRNNPAAELRRFYTLFPPVDTLPDQLERLYGLARQAKLDLQQGEYRLERQGEGMLSYRITLPTRGAYSQIRAFVGATLREMPTVSIDALRFERKRAGDPQLDAQVRLTMYFRPRDDSEAK
jgi:hypothetical protein